MEPILIEIAPGKQSMTLDPHEGQELVMLFKEKLS